MVRINLNKIYVTMLSNLKKNMNKERDKRYLKELSRTCITEKYLRFKKSQHEINSILDVKNKSHEIEDITY